MAQNKDFIIKKGLVVQAQGSVESTSTITGAIVTPGGIGIGGNANIAGSLTVSGIDLLAYDGQVIYVSEATGNDSTGDGRRVQSAYKTIKYALSQATTGDKVYIEPGVYTEEFPLTVPQGVSVKGAALRAVTVQATTATNTSDCFLMNGESYISDLTISGFYDPGYAFKFATGAKITTRSPYIERVSVITRGSVPTSEDPYGFLSGDAGNGAYLDAGVLDPTSLEPAMLWNEVTMIVPNATGWYMTNGARAELLNGFTYFADKAIQAEIGALGYGGVGRTRLRLSGVSGIFSATDTITYYSNTGTVLASGVIDEVIDDYIYIQGPSWGFKTATEANTTTQVIYTTGTWAATATQILLADYHQFGASLRCIGSAAVFGNQGVLANGTGTDLKLIAFNLSHIGAGGDLTLDDSLVSQANEIIETNGGKIYYQTVDQFGDFRVGNQFVINQRTGDVSFGNSTVNLTTLTSLTITDGINSTVLEPASISVGTLALSGNSLISTTGNINVDPAGAAIILNSDTRVQGSLTVTNTLRLTNTVNATNSTTGALQVDGGVSVDKDIWLGGNINVNGSATIVDLFVTGNAVIPGGFTATSFTSTELTVVGPAALQQLTATLSTLTELTVTEDAVIQGNFEVSGTTLLTVVTGTDATFATLILTSTSNAISTQSGTLQVRGGVGIGRDLYVGGSTYLAGDLFVDGTQFSINSTNIVTGDKTITLSSATAVAATAIDSGILIGQPAGGFVSFLFNGIDSWKVKGSIVPNGTANLGAALNPFNVIRGNSIFDNNLRVLTSVTPTAGLGIAITDLTSGGPGAQFVVTNTGVLSVVAGTDTQVTQATGNVQINLTSTLQTVTARGSATNRPLQLTANTPSTSQTTGTLVVTGGVGVSGAIYAGNIFSNGAAVWTTATLTNNNQLSNGAGYLTSSTLGEYGVSAIGGGLGITVNQSTGNVIVSNAGVVTLAGTQFIGISASSGTNVSITNLGVQQAVAGSGIAVSAATGSVTISSVDTLQLVTQRGATTNQPVAFTATNLSASTSSGQAVLVSGGLGALAVYATNVFDSGNRVLTSVAAVGGNAISISAVSTGSGSTTFTINNTGVTTATGTAYLGVSGSNGNVTFTNLGVQTLTAGTDTAVSASTGTVTVWNASTLQSVTNRGSTTNQAISISNATATTSTNTGALTVQGGVGIGDDLYVGGDVTIVGQLNAAIVLGSITTASNVFGGTAGSLVYQEQPGVTDFIAIGGAGSLLQSNGSTATFINTSSIHVAAAQFAVTATNVGGGIVVASSGTFNSSVNILDNTASTSTSSGALRISGGVGVGGNLYARELYDSNNRVVTSITPSAGTAIGISSLVANGPLASFAITNLGVQAAAGTTYLGVSSSTGTVTFTNLGVQTVSGSSYLGVSAATGTVTLTNLGVQTLTAGTDTAVSASTGTITVWNTSTLQTVTGRGAVTNNAIAITNLTGSSTSTAGALTVGGGVGIGENLNVGGRLNVAGSAVFASDVIFQGSATFVYSTNTYFTDHLIDLHTNPAGVNTRWTNDDGRDIGLRLNYFNRTLNTGTVAALYLDNTSQWLEWWDAGSGGTSNTDIWFTGTSYGSFRLGAIELRNTTNSTNTTTGALVVSGGVGIGRDVHVGGNIFAGGAQVITAATLGSFGVSQILAGPAISVSPASGTGTVTIGNLGVRSLSAGSGLQVSTSTGSVIVQSIDTLELVTSRGNSSTSIINLTNNTQATTPTNGALTVQGGVGIGRDLQVGGGVNVVGVSTFTGAITGRITTASNILGGTAGALPYQFASGETQFIGIGVVGSVLTSNGTTPTYQTTQTLVVGFAQRSTTATNIASGTAGQIPFQASGGFTSFTGGTGSEGNILVSRGTGTPTFQNTLTLAGTVNATNTLSGALQVRGGAGIGGDLWVGGTGYFSGSQVVTAANLGLFGVAQIVAGTAIAIDPATGTGTVTISNIGVTSLTTGTLSGIAISTSTGTVNIASIDTLQLVTQRGPTTNQPISITATNVSATTSTGQALLVSGGIGALVVRASNLFDSNNRVITSVFPAAGNGISITGVSTSNANVSFTINNTGVTSLAGTTYLGVSAATGAVQITNLGVQTLTAGTDTAVSASTGTVTVWTTSTLQSITNRGSITTNAITIANATVSTSTVTGALTVIGGIGVQGDIYARNIYTNGQIVGGATNTSTNLAGGDTGSIVYQTAPGTTGFIGIGTSGTVLVSNGTTATWQPASTLGAQQADQVKTRSVSSNSNFFFTFVDSNNSSETAESVYTTSTVFINPNTGAFRISRGQINLNSTNTDFTNGIKVGRYITGESGQKLALTNNGNGILLEGGGNASIDLQAGGNITVGTSNIGVFEVYHGQVNFANNPTVNGALRFANTLTVTNNTQATSTVTGAVVVNGGMGIGGNVWIGGTLFASIDGSISTASNIAGGTAGSIVYQESSGRTRFIGIGANGFLLQSNGSTATFISTSTLLVGGAVIAGATNNLGGGTVGSIPYQIALNQTGFIGIGPNTSLLQSNGTTATWATTSTITVNNAITAGTASRLAGGAVGSIPYQAATGNTQYIGIGAAGSVLQSDGTTATWFSTGTVLVGAAQNINGGQTGFIPYQASPNTTRFIGTGTVGSLLQMGSSTATFVSTSSITVGFATQAVNATNAQEIIGGVAGQLVYQSASNTTDFVAQGVAGTVLVAGGTGSPVWQNTLTLAGTVNATNTQSGTLVVNGGVGVAKDLYVGGVLFATVSGSINTASNIAGGAQGSIPIQTAPGVTSLLPIGVNGTMLRSNGTTLQYVTTTSLHVGTADNASGVINIAGGALGSIPYQTAAGVTRFIGIGPNGFLLQSNGTTATWVTTGSLVAGVALEAVNIRGGAANQIPYQTASSQTAFSSNLTFNGTALTVGGNASATAFTPTSITVPTNGLYGASNQIGIATNSTSRLFILANGNVGIGNTAPTVTLDVTGGFRVSGIGTFTNTLSATSITSAALDVDGGISVGQNIVVFGGYNAVSSSTGAVRVIGGIGATGDIWAREIYADSIDVRANAVIMATAFS